MTWNDANCALGRVLLSGRMGGGGCEWSGKCVEEKEGFGSRNCGLYRRKWCQKAEAL